MVSLAGFFNGARNSIRSFNVLEMAKFDLQGHSSSSLVLCPHSHNDNVMSHEKLSLAFFSTFDPIELSPQSVVHEKVVLMLCEDTPSRISTMFICPVTNVLGRITLIPCYMDGQNHLTIPHRFRKSNLG